MLFGTIRPSRSAFQFPTLVEDGSWIRDGGISMNVRMRVGLAALFFLGGFSPAWSQGNDFASLRQQADAGHAKAQFSLANHYFRGRDVAQDYTQALIWNRQAADQGLAD